MRGGMIAAYWAVLLCSFAWSVCAQGADPPNLIITLSDDYSASELGHLTRGFPTLEGARAPNLNRLKNEGVSFLTAWSMPICGPTRGSLLTGLYGQVTGWMSNKKPNDGGLGINYGTFANLAKENGYRTMIAGKWQMSGEVNTYGFDEACLWNKSDDPDTPMSRLFAEYDADERSFINPSNGPLQGQRSRYWHPFIIQNGTMLETGPNKFGPNMIFDCAMDFISRQKALGNKFLLYMPMLLTHSDWDYFRPEAERSITNFIPVPRVNAAGNIVGREAGPGSMKRNIEYQDYLMGRLMRHVEREGERENTITFFMGDNGSLGYGKKKQTNERSTRVPLIVHGPTRIQARRITRQLASVNDIYATVAGLISANTNLDRARPQSLDLSPFLLGRRATTGRNWLYGYLEDPINSASNGRWIRNRRYILDGNKDFWRCPTVDERSCEIIDPENGTQAARVKGQFEVILCLLEKNRPVDPSRLFQTSRCNLND